MYIEFDAAKDEANFLKHGMSLRQAAEMDWGSLVLQVDRRRDYGEVREIGYGLIGSRLHCVVFVRLPDDRYRVISLRKANRREVRLNAKAKSEDHHAD